MALRLPGARRLTPRVRRVLGWVGSVFLGLVLLVALWGKVLDPESFADLVRAEGLDFLLPARGVATVAIALEAGVAVLLLSGVRRWWSLALASALALFFLFLTGRTYVLSLQGVADSARSCGCFGNLIERTPAEAFWQDLLLLVPALALAWVGWDGPGAALPRRRTLLAGGLAAAVALLSWATPGWQIDDLATRLRPGISATDVCAGREEGKVCLRDVVPDLEAGEFLFVIADLGDPGLAERVASWNEYALSGRTPALWVLTPATAEEIQNFLLERGATFLVVEAPPSLLRPLYRRLPRAFRVEGGRVTATWSGYPDVVTGAAVAGD